MIKILNINKTIKIDSVFIISHDKLGKNLFSTSTWLRTNNNSNNVDNTISTPNTLTDVNKEHQESFVKSAQLKKHEEKLDNLLGLEGAMIEDRRQEVKEEIKNIEKFARVSEEKIQNLEDNNSVYSFIQADIKANMHALDKSREDYGILMKKFSNLYEETELAKVEKIKQIQENDVLQKINNKELDDFQEKQFSGTKAINELAKKVFSTTLNNVQENIKETEKDISDFENLLSNPANGVKEVENGTASNGSIKDTEKAVDTNAKADTADINGKADVEDKNNESSTAVESDKGSPMDFVIDKMFSETPGYTDPED